MSEKIERADSDKTTGLFFPKASFGHQQPIPIQDQEKGIDDFAVTWEEIERSLDRELEIEDIQGNTTGLKPTIPTKTKDELPKIPSSIEPYLTPQAQTRLLNNEKLCTSAVKAVLDLEDSITQIEEMKILAKQSPEDPAYVKDLIQIHVNTGSTDEFLRVRDQVHEIAIAAEENGITLHTHVIPEEE